MLGYVMHCCNSEILSYCSYLIHQKKRASFLANLIEQFCLSMVLPHSSVVFRNPKLLKYACLYIRSLSQS